MDLVDGAKTIDHAQSVLGIVIPDERRGLFVVGHQPGFKAFCVVIGAAFEIAGTTIGAFSVCRDRLGVVVVDLTAAATGGACCDTVHQSFVIHTHFNHGIEGLALVCHQLGQRIGLLKCAGEAVKDKAALVVACQLFADQADHDLVGDQFAAGHHIGDAFAHVRATVLGRAQHVTGGKLHHAALFDEETGLRALARAGRSEEDNVHRRAGLRLPRFLDLPRSWDFSINPSY